MLCRVAAVLVMLFAASPVWAGLIERYFPGKSEAEVATEFEAGLSGFLATRLREPAIFVRMYAPVAKNVEVYVQLKSVEGERIKWTTLVNTGWLKDTTEYALEPHGKDYTFDVAELPPAEVATWFGAKGRTAGEIVGCACWLAAKGELWLANGRLAALAAVLIDARKDVQAWLAEKNGWTVPAEGLLTVETHDLKHNENGTLLVSAEGKTAWFQKLDEEVKDAFKALQKLQGNDVKSKPGLRKGSPKVRLDILLKHTERFALTYAGTDFMAKKGAKDVQAIIDAIKADLEWIETEKFKAQRKGIEDDWAGAAKHYDQLVRADPLNPDLLLATGEAFGKAAKIKDAGRKAADPAAAKRSAVLFEDLIAVYPQMLGYYNNAGLGWQAAGEKSKARQHYEEVLRRTDKKELKDTEKSNREFAEKQLELVK